MRYPDDRNSRNVRIFNKNFLRTFNDDGILGIDPDMVIPGQHTEHIFAGLCFYPPDAVFKKTDIPPEPVDDESFDLVTMGLFEAIQGSDDLGKYPASVDVG